MKKTLIALAVSGAAMAAGVNASEVFNADGTSLNIGGRVEARMSIQDGEVADNSRARINFAGKQAINDNLYGVGFYEAELTTDDQGTSTGDDSTSDVNNRYIYAGLGGDFGLVTYGKNDGSLGVITDFTDIMAYHGDSAADKLVVADRADNNLTYKGQFDALGLKANYRFADRTEDTINDEYSNNDQDGYALSATYSILDSGVTLGAGYADQDVSDEFMLAASYAVNDFYLAGLYTSKSTDNADDYDGYEVAAAYTFDQTKFTATYNLAEVASEDTVENLAVDATYFFKPNFRSYISYNFNLLSDEEAGSSIAAEDEVALGLRYDF
jgi:outer membrane protein OmpU